jgi:hypothetical protein
MARRGLCYGSQASHLRCGAFSYGQGVSMRTFIMALMGLFFATSAVAQQRPLVVIMSEGDGENERRCGISNAGLEAAASGVLRRNGFRLSPNVSDPETMIAYVTADAIGTQSFCSVHFKVIFKFTGFVVAPWGHRYFVDHVICSQGHTRHGPPQTLQAHLRNIAVELTEICIHEEERKRRR